MQKPDGRCEKVETSIVDYFLVKSGKKRKVRNETAHKFIRIKG